MSSLIFAFLAGVLSILSPCVLPILPIVLGAAATGHKLGAAALAAGLAVSFVVIGLFVATVGFSLGLDGSLFRYGAAALMIAVGAVLLLPSLQARFALASGPIANWTDRHIGQARRNGLAAQFGIGFLLGAVWSPCVGPTLGAASLLAAQGQDLPQVAAVMLAFGVGAAVPLLALGIVSREAVIRWRATLLTASSGIKAALGVFLLLVGTVVILGIDKRVETILVDASPQWLTDLTTRF
jgi:cytochrome c-type biogenesis protein